MAPPETKAASKTKRIPRELCKNLKGWATGLRETILQPHIEGYADARVHGWKAEREYLERVFNEFHARVSWRVCDHQQPPNPLPVYDPNNPPPVEDLNPEESVARAARIREINARIRRWLFYRVRKRHEAFLGKTDPRKNPYFVLMAKLSGIYSPPKARQAYQQFMKERYQEEIHPAVKKRWHEHVQRENLAADALPGPDFRGKVSRDVFKALPPDRQVAFSMKARDEAQTAKDRYEKDMKSPVSRRPVDIQKCIDNLPNFLQPIIQGIQERTGFQFFIMYGGPVPRNDGEITAYHLNYGENTAQLPFSKFKPDIFNNGTSPSWRAYLESCYSDADKKAAALIDEDDEMSPEPGNEDSESSSESSSGSDSEDEDDLNAIKPSRKRGRQASTTSTTRPPTKRPKPSTTTAYEACFNHINTGTTSTKKPRKKSSKQSKVSPRTVDDENHARSHSAGNSKPRKPVASSSPPHAQQVGSPSSMHTSSATASAAPDASTVIPPPTTSHADSARQSSVSPAGSTAPAATPTSTVIPAPTGSQANPASQSVVPAAGSIAPAATPIPDTPSPSTPPAVPTPLPPLAARSPSILPSAPVTAPVDSSTGNSTVPEPLNTVVTPQPSQAGAVTLSSPPQPVPTITQSSPHTIPPNSSHQDQAHQQPSRSLVPPPGPATAPLPLVATQSLPSAPALNMTTVNRTFPDNAPDWFKNAFHSIDAEHLDPVFNIILDLFCDIESSYGFKNPTKGLPAGKRPIELNRWIGAGRWRGKAPVVNDPARFSSHWWTWWSSLQPVWRERSLSGRPTIASTYGDDWAALQFPGQNGILSVIATLSWWGNAVGRAGDHGPGSRADWAEAVRDVTWMFQGLLKFLGSLALVISLNPTPKAPERALDLVRVETNGACADVFKADTVFEGISRKLALPTSRHSAWKKIFNKALQPHPLQEPAATPPPVCPLGPACEEGPSTSWPLVIMANCITADHSLTCFMTFKTMELCRERAWKGTRCNSFYDLQNWLQTGAWLRECPFLTFSTQLFGRRAFTMKDRQGAPILSIVRNTFPPTSKRDLLQEINALLDGVIQFTDTQDSALVVFDEGAKQFPTQPTVTLTMTDGGTGEEPPERAAQLQSYLQQLLQLYKRISPLCGVETPFSQARILFNGATRLEFGKAVLIVADCPAAVIIPDFSMTIQVESGDMLLMHLDSLGFSLQHYLGRLAAVIFD